MRTCILTLFLTFLLPCWQSSCVNHPVQNYSFQPKKHSFAIYFLDKEEQKDVWRYATFLVDLDKLKIEDNPFVTEADIESFDQNKISFKREITLPKGISATGLFFVIVIDGEKEVLGRFLTLLSSIRGDEATTMVFSERVKEIKIPQHCKRLNTYLRTLYKKRKIDDS